jgi:hypothetical protein
MANGKHHDNPLTDLLFYGQHPFPSDVEQILLPIDELGRFVGRWPLGENSPFGGREFDWERGIGLDEARRELARLLEALEEGRGDEILVDPRTGRPFK